jgi:hypothetical protein
MKRFSTKRNLLCLGACASLMFVRLEAQTFNYSVSVDTTQSYQALTSKTVLNADTASWPQSKTLTIGFSFPFLGQNFSSLTIEKNNYISFDADRKYSILAFPGFSCKKDNSDKYSTVAYAISGTSPNRILKIEYGKMGSTDQTCEYLNYQVFLYETGIIEVTTGTHSYPTADSTNLNDTLSSVLIGLINTNMDTNPRGLFLSGSPLAPASQPVNDSNPDLSFIRSMPRAGTKYSFIPN